MNRTFKIIQLAVLFLCLAYIVIFFSKNTETLSLLKKLRPTAIMVLICLSVLYQVIHSYRYKVIIDKCSGKLIRFDKWFRIFIQTRFLNLFIPQSGNIYRGVSLKKSFQISYTDYISSFSSFVWMDTCLNLILAALVIRLVEPNLSISGMNTGFAVSMMALFITLSPFAAFKGSQLISRRSGKKTWLHGKLDQVITSTVTNLNDLQYVITFVSLGLITLVRTIIFYHILFSSFGHATNGAILVLFYTLFKLSSLVVVTPGNLGIQEIAFGVLGSQLGIGMSEGILVCAVGRVIGTSVIIALGIGAGGIDLLLHHKEFRPS